MLCFEKKNPYLRAEYFFQQIIMSEIHCPKKIFNCEQIKNCMHEILHRNLHDQFYDFTQCHNLTKTLSNLIKDALKTFDYDRYKFIIQIVIYPENNDQLQMFCRSFWDNQTDRFAQSIYINSDLICIATAFGIFYY